MGNGGRGWDDVLPYFKRSTNAPAIMIGEKLYDMIREDARELVEAA